MERIDLTPSGFESGPEPAIGGALAPHAGARRHEVATLPAALLPAWRASIDWLEGLGWEWIHRRVAEAQASARAGLAGVPGVRIITPPGRPAGLVAFTVGGADPGEAAAARAARGVIVPWIAHPPSLRASLGFFSDASDINRLVEGVTAIGGDC
jgi:selenocysteine lyase/cysteine desulfurase